MKFSIVAIAAIAGIATASPIVAVKNVFARATPSSSSSYSYPTQGSYYGCLSNSTAKTLVDGFVGLITNYSTANAEALLSKDFTDTSDSINVMTSPPTPLGSVTFASKAAFEAGQGAQPKVPMTVLSIDEISCTNVAFRWQATPNSAYPDLKVKGINSFTASNLNNTDAGWQIKTMYSEFNNCVWIRAIGGTCKMPGA